MLTGFVAGLLLSMPVGPVNLTIINQSSRRGFLSGILVGLGASTMDLIYCAIAFTGFTQFFKITIIKTSMEVFTFVFFYLSARNFYAPGTWMRRRNLAPLLQNSALVWMKNCIRNRPT